MTTHSVQTPITDEVLRALRAGDMVRISGVIYGARDAAHKRMVAALTAGQALPVDLRGQILYYVGPAPAKEGHAIGPAGPTTSGRMDPYTAALLAQGVKGFIGKGYRSVEVKQALVARRAIYMAAVGGAAALLARQIEQSRVVAYADLGTEAIHEFVVNEFPAIVVNDIYGGDAYETGRAAFAM
ncbi:MAG: fumarate hydratase C-terminal domain-containing protein [Caldilineaceae bacterium]|nr:fumarate hydratase C-terminal domain-containing protein [Caldilineaceae bacterium]